jgi:hypothetical protein
VLAGDRLRGPVTPVAGGRTDPARRIGTPAVPVRLGFQAFLGKPLSPGALVGLLDG